MKKRSILAVLLAMIMCVMGACGEKFDSKAYVKSCLDAQFKGEYDEYIKITESKKEEAEKLYTDGLDTLMSSYSVLPISDEMNKKLRDAYADMLKAANYTVKEEKKDGDNITVTVGIKPMKCFENYEADLKKLQDEFTADIQKKVNAGEKVPSESELMEQMAGIVCDDLIERVKTTEYGEEQIIEVKVKKDKDNVYTVDENDLAKVAEAAVQM